MGKRETDLQTTEVRFKPGQSFGSCPQLTWHIAGILKRKLRRARTFFFSSAIRMRKQSKLPPTDASFQWNGLLCFPFPPSVCFDFEKLK